MLLLLLLLLTIGHTKHNCPWSRAKALECGNYFRPKNTSSARRLLQILLVQGSARYTAEYKERVSSRICGDLSVIIFRLALVVGPNGHTEGVPNRQGYYLLTAAVAYRGQDSLCRHRMLIYA